MARQIKVNDESYDEIRKEFEEFLKTGRFADGKISFSKQIGKNDKKTELFFTESAWVKMRILVDGYDSEIGWHGTAYRVDGGYLVTDIFVYPQTVTGTTVESDKTEYPKWLEGLPDDVFDNLRFQGHSHVNMGTGSSGTDEKDRAEWLEMLKDDMFYIFVITNKKNEMNIWIYDLAENQLYERADVTVKLVPDGTGIIEFSEQAKELVKKKTYVSQYPVTTGQTGGKYTYSTKNAAGKNYYSGYWDDDDDSYYWRNWR